jgi:hypothetical protein
MKEQTYQQRELAIFRAEQTSKSHKYFDTWEDFEENLTNSNPLTDLEWIENGSYGLGACLYMQRIVKQLTIRTNDIAQLGRFLLSVLYGEEFPVRYWWKFRDSTRQTVNIAVRTWLKQEHNFAQEYKD